MSAGARGGPPPMAGGGGGAAGASAPTRTIMPQRGPFGGPVGPPQKAKSFGPSAKRLVRQLGPERRLLAVVMVLALASVTASVLGPKVLGEGTDIIFAGFRDKAAGGSAGIEGSLAAARPSIDIDFAALARVLEKVLVLYACASLFAWSQLYLLNTVVQRTVRRLRTAVEAKLARVPLAYFDGQPHGEVLSRATNDIDNVAQGLSQTLGQILTALLSVVGMLAMMVVISPWLALVTLVTVPLSIVVTAKIGRRAQQGFGAQWKHLGALNGQIEEAFTGHALVKVFGRTKATEARFRAKNQELYEASFSAQFVSSMIMPAINFVGNLTFVGIAVAGGLMVAAGSLAIGGVQAFIQYSRQFTQQLSQLASLASVLQSAVASAERAFEVLDAAEQSPDVADGALHVTSGEVRFEDVSFRYQATEPLIEHLSLVAKPGQTVAIVGPTGAGKTTLVNLLMRFYELDGGRILLDGVDIASVPRRALRSRIGMVLQDTWLFGGTIRDNIRYGNPGASDEALVAAAKAAYVDRFVRALPLGYDTVIDEESSNLSAGEKQLITIARAFIAEPALLVLDEATSSVDTRTELLVQEAMAALRKDRTSFVIAHRLSTIRNASVILVMDGGRIVEQGTHDALVARGGAYAALHAAQFAAATASAGPERPA